MGYQCQNFKNGQVLTAECLNKMDRALKDACDKADASDEHINDLIDEKLGVIENGAY